MSKGFLGLDSVNGDVEIRDGETYWMGSKVEKCPMCGIAPTNVDDCGEFGNPECPYFGIGREAYEAKLKRWKEIDDAEEWPF